MQNSINILSTMPLSGELISLFNAENIDPDILSFITIEPIETVEVQQEIENALIRSATVIFSSKNAVEAVGLFLFDVRPAWRIWCVGEKTRQLAEQLFGEEFVAGSASSAAELGELILNSEPASDLIFFCGNRRRDELPEMFRDNNIGIDEIIVYETIAVTQNVSKQYHGILFFSPSAADSFFETNKVGGETILFAIGKTTAAALKQHCSNKIISPAEPGKENLVDKVLEYFT